MVGCEVASLCSRPMKLELNASLKSMGWGKKILLRHILSAYVACYCLGALLKQLKRHLNIQEAPQTQFFMDFPLRFSKNNYL